MQLHLQLAPSNSTSRDASLGCEPDAGLLGCGPVRLICSRKSDGIAIRWRLLLSQTFHSVTARRYWSAFIVRNFFPLRPSSTTNILRTGLSPTRLWAFTFHECFDGIQQTLSLMSGVIVWMNVKPLDASEVWLSSCSLEALFSIGNICFCLRRGPCIGSGPISGRVARAILK